MAIEKLAFSTVSGCLLCSSKKMYPINYQHRLIAIDWSQSVPVVTQKAVAEV